MCSPQHYSQQQTELFLCKTEKAVCVCVLTNCILLIYFITFKVRWCCRPQSRPCCFCFSSLCLSLLFVKWKTEEAGPPYSTGCVGGFESSPGVINETEQHTADWFRKVGKCTKQIHLFVCQNVWPWFWSLFWGDWLIFISSARSLLFSAGGWPLAARRCHHLRNWQLYCPQ